MNITLEYKGGIQGQNRGKILRLLLHAIRSHLHQRILLPPLAFWDLRFLRQQLKRGKGLGFLYIISFFTYKNQIFFIILF
jgi:hypothetical protein